MNDILKTSNTKFRPTKFEDKFKSGMIDKWVDELNTVWETKNLHDRLTVLNEKKQQLHQEGSVDKAW